MARNQRDYQAEYQRRLHRAAKAGLSRSQARGHPKLTEAYASKKLTKPLDDSRLQLGLSLLRQEKSIGQVARELGVSRERLSHELNRLGATEKRRGRWVVKDSLPRRMLLYSKGKAVTVTLPNKKVAHNVANYMGQVRKFLASNDRGYVSFYDGMSVTDVNGVTHPFETDPNALYRLAGSGPDSFEQIYRIVI
jgi:AraC-like DNA-binding protein